MDTPQNFRTAFNGFNREDVVRYLEYLNAKQAAQVGQLTEEADALRQQLAQKDDAGSDSVSFEEMEDLRTKLEASESSNAALENRCADLEERMAEKVALEKRVVELEEKLADNRPEDARTADLEAKISEQKSRIAELEKQLEEKDAKLADLEKLPEEKQQLEAQIADLEEKLTSPVQSDSQLALQAQLQRHCVELEKSVAALTADKEALQQKADALTAEKTGLEQKLAQRPAAAAPIQDRSLAEQELAAYRRAERAERVAKERADLVYQKTNGILADATAKVDGIAGDIGSMADDILSQLQTLQAAVTGSKQALKDAAEIMYALRPQADEE